MNVRRFLGLGPLLVAAIPVATLARDCNEVKAEIDAKIKAKGGVNYALQIVNGPDVKEGQIVGNCETGAKKIVYYKGHSSKNALQPSSTSPKRAQTLSPHQQHRSLQRQPVELGSTQKPALPQTEKLHGAAAPGKPAVIRSFRKMPPQESQLGNPSAPKILATEKARKNELAEQSSNYNPGGEPTAGLDFVNPADDLRKQQAELRRPEAVLVNRQATLKQERAKLRQQIAARASPTEEAVSATITCDAARAVVADFGFTEVKPELCAGKRLRFGAIRDGNRFSIEVAANGELTKVQRLP
jgi:hypothetical protein